MRDDYAIHQFEVYAVGQADAASLEPVRGSAQDLVLIPDGGAVARDYGAEGETTAVLVDQLGVARLVAHPGQIRHGPAPCGPGSVSSSRPSSRVLSGRRHLSRQLRILTYNIHKGYCSGNRRFVLESMRSLIAETGADLVFLQEIHGSHRGRRRHEERYTYPDRPHFEYLADQSWPGVLGMYKRAMEYSAPPRIVAMGHEPQPEFRTKWGCKPGSLDATCGSVTKANNWVSDGGSGSSAEGTSATPPAECKYPGMAADFSDYRLMRWALAFVMMSDGYFSTNQTTSTWNTGLPWYDEYVGGSQVNDVGWCGQPLTSAAGAEQWTSQTGMDGVFKREFDNCIVLHNPPRGTPTVDNTKTESIPAAGVGKRQLKGFVSKTEQASLDLRQVEDIVDDR